MSGCLENIANWPICQIASKYWSFLVQSLGNTMLLTVLALVFATLIGLVFAMCNISKSRTLRFVGNCYVDAVRGVPLIVLAFFIYFGIPQAFKMMGIAIKLPALQAGTIALSMNCGAYMAEIIRAGIESIDRGQMEAARSLGLSYARSMYRVVLPQAFRVMIPSIINQFIITLKDTSILSVIGFPELTNTGRSIAGNTFKSLETWAIVGVMYLIVIVTLSKIAKVIEERMKRGRV